MPSHKQQRLQGGSIEETAELSYFKHEATLMSEVHRPL